MAEVGCLEKWSSPGGGGGGLLLVSTLLPASWVEAPECDYPGAAAGGLSLVSPHSPTLTRSLSRAKV